MLSVNAKRKKGLKKFTFVPAMIAAMLIFAIGSVATAQPAGEDISDHDITLAIEIELLESEAVPSHLIDVETSNGIVTMSGTVSNLLARDRAVRLAETIKGVRAVVDKIVVTPLERPDQQIKTDVVNALLMDPAADSYELETEVNDGIVTLSGEVQSWQEMQLAKNVTKSVKGVKDVMSEITISDPMSRADNEIEKDIARRLEADVWVDDNLIDVSVNNGNVELSGTVGSAAEKRWATYDAWVNGTRSVDTSELEIEWWARDQMRRKSAYEAINDQDIKENVKDAFFYDPRVFSFDIDVDVQDGVVTLYGEVDNLKAKKAAAEDARNTLGVWRVKNFIRVRPNIIPGDQELSDKVEMALQRDPYIDPFDVEVMTSNGLVYLNGDVSNSFEKEHAEEVAWRVNGVVDVVNLLDYQYEWTNKSDWEIMHDANQQMYWNPFVDAADVNVEVDNGVVTLSGNVDTWLEKLNAQKNAYEAGARDVDNNLEVTYYNPMSFHTY